VIYTINTSKYRTSSIMVR